MELDFITVLITVLSLVILIIPGYLLTKTGILKEGADKVLSGIVLYVCQPMLMFMSLQKEYDEKIAVNMLIVFGLSLLVHLIMIALLYIVFRNKSNSAKINVVRFASVFGNCGYMGIPFLQMLFSGSKEIQGEILIYCAIVIAVFNLLNWSVGVYMITGNKKDMSLKKAVLNPTTLATLLGIVLFLTVRKPIASLGSGTLNSFLSKFMGSIDSLGSMVTPTAMILIGIKLAFVPLKQLFLDKWAYISSLNKLVIMPIIAILVVVFLPIGEQVKYALFFTLAMPSATSTVLFSVQFGGDGDSASVFVLLSTVISIVTIPLMFLLFKAMLTVI